MVCPDKDTEFYLGFASAVKQILNVANASAQRVNVDSRSVLGFDPFRNREENKIRDNSGLLFYRSTCRFLKNLHNSSILASQSEFSESNVVLDIAEILKGRLCIDSKVDSYEYGRSCAFQIVESSLRIRAIAEKLDITAEASIFAIDGQGLKAFEKVALKKDGVQVALQWLCYCIKESKDGATFESLTSHWNSLSVSELRPQKASILSV